MKIEIRREEQDTWLALTGKDVGGADYQIKMLDHVRIAGILTPRPEIRDGETAFFYRISGMVSIQDYFRRNSLGEKEILCLTEEIVKVAEKMRNYLLEAACLVLEPSCIYKNNGGLGFCYLPGLGKTFSESYHQLTEYFVRELDYGDPGAVQAGCRLHKYSMQENFHLGDTLSLVKKEIKEARGIREAEEIKEPEKERVRESAEHFRGRASADIPASRKKKRKTSKWGDWENL